MLELSTSVQYVKGIGPRLAEVLGAKGIHTVDDLLHYLPFRYEDRVNPRGISELRAGEMATVIAEVRTSGLFRTRRMPIFQMTAGQGRSRLKCIWFNATYLRDRFKPGQLVALSTARWNRSAAENCNWYSRSLKFSATPPTTPKGRTESRLLARSRQDRPHLRVGRARDASLRAGFGASSTPCWRISLRKSPIRFQPPCATI